jgi:hypothetical protein
MRKKTALALVAMLMALAGASFLVYRWANRPRTGASTGITGSGTTAASTGVAGLETSAFADAAPMPRSAAAAASRANPNAVSRVNPYAVVRHGICAPSNVPDQKEASRKKWEALLRDPLWQSIFSGVNPEEFDLEKTSLPLNRYVTYWKMVNGQAIHWTGRKILIPAGTRVFAGKRGDMYLCACGNQIAAVLPPTMSGTVLPPAMSGTVLPPEEEPSVAYLVPPEPEPNPGSTPEIPGETPSLFPPTEVATTTPSNESELIPPISSPTAPITPILLAGSSPPGGGSGTGPIPPNEPPVTPEPGTLSLILIGLGASIVARRYHKRR